jgi:glycosyltransferase involved in cell wall biosynthesis
VRPYLRAVGRIPAPQAFLPKKVLVITNLFPPQELGGYGRMMWEFANGLRARGHEVRVLSSDSAAYGKTPTEDEAAMESCVSRTLELCGEWRALRSGLLPKDEVRRRDNANVERVGAELKTFQPDVVLAGNLDFLGQNVIQVALNASVPVLHALANARPGYGQAHQPTSPLYWVAPCSDWNGTTFRADGYHPARMETLYPGARIDRFFRIMLPDNARLRICYASLVMPYKGADTLVHALVALNRWGVDFTAEIAGEAPDAGFLAELTDLIRAAGLEERVRFTGFLDRNQLGALFSRSNVLVFPSQFPEPFGISQVEALAAGLVVVTSATGGAKEIVQDGIDGIHFEAGNSNDLADKLRSLSVNPLTMTALQQAAQSRSVQFSLDNAIAKIEELMEAQFASLGAVSTHAFG